MTAATQREFTLTRVLDAPRELVWKAWTDPDQLAQWWGPEGLSTPRETIELDPRPGGAFRLVMVAGGTEFPSEMEFRELDEPERLVFGWDDQRGLGAGEVTVTFTEVDGRTEMTTQFVGYATDQVAEMAQAGWRTQLDKLERLVAR